MKINDIKKRVEIYNNIENIVEVIINEIISFVNIGDYIENYEKIGFYYADKCNFNKRIKSINRHGIFIEKIGYTIVENRINMIFSFKHELFNITKIVNIGILRNNEIVKLIEKYEKNILEYEKIEKYINEINEIENKMMEYEKRLNELKNEVPKYFL